METRSTTRRIAKITSYALTHSLSKTARRYRILGPDGKPSRALVSRMIDGWVPRTRECRIRCGLPPRIRLSKPVTINQLLQLPIQDQPPEILRLAFENRTEMP